MNIGDEIRQVFDKAMTHLKASMDAGPEGVCAILTSEESTLVYRLLTDALEARQTPPPRLGPLVIACDGGLVQSVSSNDERLIHKLDIMVIDYDVDGAETVYSVPQKDAQDPTAESDAQVHEEVCNEADAIDVGETWRRYINDEVTLECAMVNAEAEGYRVRLVPGSAVRYEWFTDEAVAFIDYPDEDAAWMAAYKDIVA